MKNKLALAGSLVGNMPENNLDNFLSSHTGTTKNKKKKKMKR